MMKYSPYLKYYLILGSIMAFALLEILTMCYRWPKTNREVQSIIFFVAGLGISVLPLSVAKISIPTSKYRFSQKTIFYLLFSGVIALTGIIFFFCPQLFEKIPIDPKTADMIPILSAMAERYTTGQKVYAFIQISGPMYPIYLPALWLPFIIPNTFHFDPRWLIETFLAIGIMFIIFTVPKKELHIRQILVLIPIFMLIWGITHKEITLITMTQEGIVIAYYLFFVLALFRFSKNPYILSTAIMLCVLSRFTLLFFFAFYLLFIWKFESKKLAYQIFGITTFFVLAVMSITQAIFHLDIFLGLSDNYLQAVKENKEKYTDLIQYSMGIAKFFK